MPGFVPHALHLSRDVPSSILPILQMSKRTQAD